MRKHDSLLDNCSNKVNNRKREYRQINLKINFELNKAFSNVSEMQSIRPNFP